MSYFEHVEVNFFHLALHLSVFLGILQNVYDSDNLDNVTTHHDHQNQYVVCVQQLSVIFLISLAVSDEEDECSSEKY